MSICYIFFVIKAYIFVLYLAIISKLFTIILETRKKIHLLCIFYHFIICTFCIKKFLFYIYRISCAATFFILSDKIQPVFAQ